MDVLKEAQALKNRMINYRRYIHQHAEVDDCLPQTTEFVKKELIRMGLTPIDLGKSGVVATIKGKQAGKTILLRADMDALPIQEETELPFQAKNGAMHACGHDFHTAMLLGAAELINTNKEQLKGTVKLMFQPAEETLKGAKDMIANGLLEKPSVDAAVMIHVLALEDIPAGKVIFLKEGYASASCDAYTILIKGRGGHGAMPQNSIDPLITMSQIHLALQTIHTREISPGAFLVLTPCLLQGGTAANIIPETARMQGTIRTLDSNVRQYAKKRLIEITQAIAQANRCEVIIDFYTECPSINNHSELNKELKNALKEILGEEMIVDGREIADLPQGTLSGSEDFSFISARVPSSIIILAANQTYTDGKSYRQHHPRVLFDEDVLPIGATIYATAAFSYLQNIN